MPPALQDWLPEGDLAWFILDAGAPMKLGAIERTYRTDGWEQAAYEPAMLVAMLRYADGLKEDEGMTLPEATLPRGLCSEWPRWEHNNSMSGDQRAQSWVCATGSTVLISDHLRTRERNNDHACNPVNEDINQSSNLSSTPKTWTLHMAYNGHVE